jgi:hypothetical protein
MQAKTVSNHTVEGEPTMSPTFTFGNNGLAILPVSGYSMDVAIVCYRTTVAFDDGGTIAFENITINQNWRSLLGGRQ